MGEPTPSEVLTRAADLIRDVAAEVRHGPWTAETPGRGAAWINVPGAEHAFALHGFPNEARWIALLNPAVAGPLAEVLEAATGMWLIYENRGWSPERVRASVGAEHRAALDLAKALLGTPEETP